MGTESSGKQGNQKLKAYLIMQFFLKNSDEWHSVQMQDILKYLKEDCGIEAERRSVYEDIKDINKILYMLDQEDEDCTIQEAEDAISDPDYGEDEKLIVSGGTNRSGYYLRRRPHDIQVDDIRLLAECVYNARFISESKAPDPFHFMASCLPKIYWKRHEAKRKE